VRGRGVISAVMEENKMEREKRGIKKRFETKRKKFK
jgi:hypothetical protein